MSSSKVVREKEMDVSRDDLIAVITDFESYPKFLPEVVSAKIDSGRKKENPRVVFELELVKRFKYVLEFSIRENEVEWKLQESDFFKKNEGAWRLKPKGKGKTAVQYELEVGFGFLVPGWITKKLTEVNLPKMLETFEERAKLVASQKA